jgi:hypothetical protein
VVENGFVKKLAIFPGPGRQEKIEFSQRTMFDRVNARKPWQALVTYK